MRPDFCPCAVIPTYDNPLTIRSTVEAVRRLCPVIVVDDGSGDAGRREIARLERDGLARVVRHRHNGGKGAAVRTGFETASRAGATHVLQIDADGQHDTNDIPRFLESAREHPDALVLGAPLFDGSQPRSRARGRGISTFWVRFETGGPVVADPQCGFRIYPLAAAREAGARGDRMEFDQEVVVHMVWRGVRVVNLPTRVRYLPSEEGGVSHFRMLRDNVRITWLHVRLVLRSLGRRLAGAPLHAPRANIDTDARGARELSGSPPGRVR